MGEEWEREEVLGGSDEQWVREEVLEANNEKGGRQVGMEFNYHSPSWPGWCQP